MTKNEKLSLLRTHFIFNTLINNNDVLIENRIYFLNIINIASNLLLFNFCNGIFKSTISVIL